MSSRLRSAVVVMIAAGLLTSACATNSAQQAAERETCAKLVAATKMALDTGSAPIDAETAAFARVRGLEASIAPNPGGTGLLFVPKSLPFPLMAAADPKDGGPVYRANARSLTPEYRQMLADEGRRCEWKAQ
jgi:hypothetical protein